MAALCASLGVAHRTLRWIGEKPAAGLPAAAREARHDLLAQAAQAEDTDLVLTGHTADDQAETVLMRQARDKGRGLAGIAPATLFAGKTWIARPLLATRREALRDFLRSRGVGWIDDPTNVSDAFERPRLRKALGNAEGEARIAAALHEAGEAAQRREMLGEAAAILIRDHADRPLPGLVRLAPLFLGEGDASIYALRILLATARRDAASARRGARRKAACPACGRRSVSRRAVAGAGRLPQRGHLSSSRGARPARAGCFDRRHGLGRAVPHPCPLTRPPLRSATLSPSGRGDFGSGAQPSIERRCGR